MVADSVKAASIGSRSGHVAEGSCSRSGSHGMCPSAGHDCPHVSGCWQAHVLFGVLSVPLQNIKPTQFEAADNPVSSMQP